MKQITEPNIEEILSLFEKIDQSNRAKGRDSISQGLFTVDVMALQTKRGKKRKLAGAGKKNMKEFDYNIHPGALYAHNPFPDNYCLFYSLEWARQKHLLSVHAFRRWKDNPRRQKNAVEKLMTACGIPEGQQMYSIEDYGQCVQNYCDTENPGIFRIVVFGTHGDFKPIWKSDAKYYEEPLILLYCEDEKHYEPVAYPGKLFMPVGQYCFPCEKPYHQKGQHNIKCRGRCRNCQQMHTYCPCKPDGEFAQSCLHCRKTFENKECWERHIQKRTGCRSVCERSKKCLYCGVYYSIKKSDSEQKQRKKRQGDEESVTLGSRDSSGAEDYSEFEDVEDGTELNDFIVEDQTNHHEGILDHRKMPHLRASTPSKWRMEVDEAEEAEVKSASLGSQDSRDEEEIIEVGGDDEVEEEVKSTSLGSKDSMDEETLEVGEEEEDSISSFIVGDLENISSTSDVGKAFEKEEEEETEIEEVSTSSFIVKDAACTPEEMIPTINTQPITLDDLWAHNLKEQEEEKRVCLPTIDAMKPDHVCGERWCKNCRQYHAKRPCWILPRKRIPKDRRIIVYDFESSQHLQPDPRVPRFQHQVNFVFAHVMCYRCIEADEWEKNPIKPCKICGDHRTFSWASFDYQGSEQHEHTQLEKDDEILPTFVQWLLHYEVKNLKHSGEEEEEEMGDSSKNVRKRKSYETICYAHNGSRYDHVLVFGEIIRSSGLQPTIVRQGNTLLEMRVKKTGIITSTTFRDTLKIIPIRLADFVKTFDLKIPNVEGKQYFPYSYNKPGNYYKQLERLPPKEDYSPNAMKTKDREKFLQWYEKNRETPFCLKDVLSDYCISDVKILIHGLVKMRQIFKDITETDITEATTLPSALIRYFVDSLRKHQPDPDQEERKRLWVALTPHLGYDQHDRQSLLARKYIKYWATTHEVDVQFCESPLGEYVHNGKYKIDGFVRRQRPEKDLAIEVFGCYWHACPHHFPDNEKLVADGTPAGIIRERDAERVAALKRDHLDVEVKWECEIQEELKNNEGMREFFDNCLDTGPINIHDAFFGGRTSCEYTAASLLKQNEELNPQDKGERTIKYKDFVSLYPYVNYANPYPVTHPRVKVYKGENGANVNWCDPAHVMCPEDQTPILGIIKCFIVPPQRVKNDIPAIPYRAHNRLLFPLCRTFVLGKLYLMHWPTPLRCADKYPNGLKDDEYSCPHREDTERGFVTTIAHPELLMALTAGYRVTKLIRAWNWPDPERDWSKTLFQPYIRRFMRIKYQASGWPDECLVEGITEEEREKRKQQVINEAYEETRITLDPEKMEFNPGLRYVAKLCLNSLWGRFGLRNRLTKSAIVRDAAGLADYLDDEKNEITMIDALNESTWLISYKSKEENVVENSSSNPIIALFTTAYARSHLLKALWKINSRGRDDCRILYMDTDSIIYDFATCLGDPLGDESTLGRLKDEYPTKEIVEFLAAAPKFYTIMLRDPITGKEEYVKKCRGVSLDYDANERLNQEKMWELVVGESFAEFERRGFQINKKGEVFTCHEKKKLRSTYTKGVLRGWRVVPYGYVHE